MADTPHASRDGSVLVLRWDRQEVRNALAPATLIALAEHITSATADDDIGAVVLTGTGDVAFSAGMDLKALRADPSSVGQAVRAWDGALSDPDRVPLIAAVNGMAMGGGFELTMKCDLVVAAEGATFGLPEVRHGIVPGGGASHLPLRIPITTALEMALLGDRFPAQRMYELGLVNRVVPADQVVPTAVELGQALSDHDRATVLKIKRMLWDSIPRHTTGS